MLLMFSVNSCVQYVFHASDYFRCTSIYFHIISFVRSVTLPINHIRRQKIIGALLLFFCCATSVACVSCGKHVYGTARK